VYWQEKNAERQSLHEFGHGSRIEGKYLTNHLKHCTRRSVSGVVEFNKVCSLPASRGMSF
jgi:hypothetical protein